MATKAHIRGMKPVMRCMASILNDLGVRLDGWWGEREEKLRYPGNDRKKVLQRKEKETEGFLKVSECEEVPQKCNVMLKASSHILPGLAK